MASQLSFGQSVVTEELRDEINKIIAYDTPINFDKTPGFIMSVIDGESCYYLTFGEAIDSSASLNIYSQFELGGCSKVFSSRFFIDWILKSDLISLDTPLSNFDLGFENLFIDSLTLGHLIFNRTSFPKRPLSEYNLSRIENPYQDYSWKDLQAFLEQTDASVIGYNSAYSHVNFGLLQFIYEKVSENSFCNGLRTYLITSDLGSANCNLDSTFTWGLNVKGEIAKPWHLDSFHASEGLFSNTQNISQYLREIITNDSLINFLKREARESIYRPSFHLTSGWSMITGVGKFDIFAMTGKTSGHSSFVAFIPETKTAVSILCNSAVGTDDLGMLVLRMINNNFKRDHE